MTVAARRHKFGGSTFDAGQIAALDTTVDDIYRILRALDVEDGALAALIAALDVRVTALEASSVTAAGVATIMLAAGKSARVDTKETQASNTTYGDLTTTGPSVSITMTGTIAIVWLSAVVNHGAAGNSSMLSVAVSGASTVAAANATAAIVSSAAAAYDNILSRVLVLTGLTPGVNVFTAKYQNNGGGTWDFFNRAIAVYAP